MLTVPNTMKSIRNRHFATGALICGAAGMLALASALPAGAQDAAQAQGDAVESAAGDNAPQNLVFGDAAGDVAAADTAQKTTAAPLAMPEPEPEEMPGRLQRTAPEGPVEGTGGAPEEDPFAAQGMRLGSFILRPSVELGLTGTREKAGSSSAVDRLLGDTALRLELESDWDRHSFTLTGEGRLQQPLSGGGDLEPEGSIQAIGRFDITDETVLTGTLGYGYEPDNPRSAAFLAATDPALAPAVSGTNDPATQLFSGALALRQQLGTVYGEAEISAERALYGAAALSDGTTVSQGDLDNTIYDARLRAGVEISPVWAPFVEGQMGLRRMDRTPDSSGFDRDATRYGLRAGTGIDLGEKLSGEIAVGYLKEDIADPALADLAGISVDAEFNWSPRRETGVGLALSTTTETGGGGSGALLYASELSVTHKARADLTLEAGLGAEYRDEQGGTDTFTLGGTAGLTYWFNRFTGLTTRLGHERVTSPDPASRSDTTTAFVGLKLQR